VPGKANEAGGVATVDNGKECVRLAVIRVQIGPLDGLTDIARRNLELARSPRTATEVSPEMNSVCGIPNLPSAVAWINGAGGEIAHGHHHCRRRATAGSGAEVQSVEHLVHLRGSIGGSVGAEDEVRGEVPRGVGKRVFLRCHRVRELAQR